MNSWQVLKPLPPANSGLTLKRWRELFNVVDSGTRADFEELGPFCYQDRSRCYIVFQETIDFTLASLDGRGGVDLTTTGYLFASHYHHYVGEFIRSLNAGGVTSLFDLKMHQPFLVDGGTITPATMNITQFPQHSG